MAETDDEKPSSGFAFHHHHNHHKYSRDQAAQPPPADNHQFMDLDMDLDSSWPLDQISFVPNPMSPFFISSSEQPFSPLWAFSDADDDNKASVAGKSLKPATLSGGAYPRFLALKSAHTDTVETDEKRRVQNLPSAQPNWGLEPDISCVIKEKMTQALRYFKESTEQHVLAQVWAPVKNGGRLFLTTSEQPFVLDPHSSGLNRYRMVSLMYMFSVDEENDGELGLPGRVFRQKLPEWTPNVQYYSSREYSRLDHALHYNVQGTLALPVFEPSGQTCVGVVELILTSQKINYAPEVDKVCKALEAVNLKSSNILDHPKPQIRNEGRQKALAEILEILSVVCESLKLPLAQTWVPCRHRNVLADGGGLRKSCSSFDGSCMGQVCMSTSDVTFYVVDAHMWGFRDACAEHHLQRGQGVAGHAFLSQSSCFCGDITQFSKTEYPLVHYARMFGVTSCFAICLCSSLTGNDEYILEFFLPPTVVDARDQQALLNSLLETMKQHFRSLRVASGRNLGPDMIEIIKGSADEKLLESNRRSHSPSPPAPDNISDQEMADSGNKVSSVSLVLAEADGSNNAMKTADVGGIPNGGNHTGNTVAKKPERKRGKTEKTISLDVLQQYFAGSLKDAAKSLGVCPTTMKRICRQHGISRWPSRKINKVNRSLTKLKRVIESVQGSDGTFGLTSLSPMSHPTAGCSISWAANTGGSNLPNSPGLRAPELHGMKNGSPISDGKGGTGVQLAGNKTFDPEGSPHEQNESVPKVSKASSGSREGSAGSPTSHDSCQGSAPHEAHDCKKPELGEHWIDTEVLMNYQGNDMNPVRTNFLPDTLLGTQAQEPFEGLLVADVGSSKDLRNLCPSIADAHIEDRIPECSWTNPQINISATEPTTANPTPDLNGRQDSVTLTIKATYKDDIIRFRFPSNSGIVELREEVAKRLKLEVGSFDIKYLDDDQELVLIVCDADLQECLDVSRSCNSMMIRLSVHDITTNLGSSCESTGE
ncbi:unnamed protein product [Rhodiola kirilowii]